MGEAQDIVIGAREIAIGVAAWVLFTLLAFARQRWQARNSLQAWSLLAFGLCAVGAPLTVAAINGQPVIMPAGPIALVLGGAAAVRAVIRWRWPPPLVPFQLAQHLRGADVFEDNAVLFGIMGHAFFAQNASSVEREFAATVNGPGVESHPSVMRLSPGAVMSVPLGFWCARGQGNARKLTIDVKVRGTGGARIVQRMGQRVEARIDGAQSAVVSAALSVATGSLMRVHGGGLTLSVTNCPTEAPPLRAAVQHWAPAAAQLAAAIRNA